MAMGLFGMLFSKNSKWYHPIDINHIYAWKFDEPQAPWANYGSGGVVDLLAAAASDPTIVGGVYYNAIKTTTGQGAKSENLSTGTSNITNALTCSAWVNLNSYTPNGSIVSKSYHNDGYTAPYTTLEMKLSPNNDGYFSCSITTATDQKWTLDVVDNAIIPLNAWTFLAFTYDQTTGIKAYKNGTLIATKWLDGYAHIVRTIGATQITGGTDVGNHLDDVATQITPPFNITMYGVSYNKISVSPNANIQFGTTLSDYFPNTIPHSTFTTAIYVFFYDNMSSSADRGIYTSFSGTAPNRQYNVEFRLYRLNTTYSINGTVTFYENKPDYFEIVYGPGLQQISQGSIGVQKSPTIYTSIQNSGNHPKPGDKYSFFLNIANNRNIDWGTQGPWFVSSNENSNVLDGAVDDVRVDNIARTAAYLLNVYNKTSK